MRQRTSKEKREIQKCIAGFFQNSLWSILPEQLEAIRLASNQKLETALAQEENPDGADIYDTGYGYQVKDGIAIIPISGPLTNKFNIWLDFFGFQSMKILGIDINKAVANPEVNKIVLDYDTPGGTVNGTFELANIIKAAGQVKPVYAYVSSMAASAGYWLASAASKGIYTTETAQLGSIGVYILHTDYSRARAAAGLTDTFIKAGKEKTLGNPYEPLSDEAKAALQKDVNYFYSLFTGFVSTSRPALDKDITKWAEGKVFIGRQAVEVGLADGISTLENLLVAVTSGGTSTIKTQEAEMPNTMTVETLQKDHAEIYNAVIEQGKAEGKVAGLAEAEANLSAKIEAAKTEAVNNDRKRGAEILALAADYQKEFALGLVAEGKTVAEATTSLLKNAQAFKAEELKKFAAGAAAPVNHQEPDPQPAPKSDLTKQWDAEKSHYPKLFRDNKDAFLAACAAWDKNEGNLQSDFGGNASAYLAYASAL